MARWVTEVGKRGYDRFIAQADGNVEREVCGQGRMEAGTTTRGHQKGKGGGRLNVPVGDEIEYDSMDVYQTTQICEAEGSPRWMLGS